jgi:hypothetical protein
MSRILKLKEESILEQIEYIDSNFRETISNCMANLDFVNSFKEWAFNPDNMCEGGIGLTLNHNKVEGLRPPEHGVPAIPDPTAPGQPKAALRKKIKENSCKIAFTQKPLVSENSRSFRVEKLRNDIVIGCVNSEDHALISEKLNYENYLKFLYGISVNCDGQITLYNKGQKPSPMASSKVRTNDMIEVTLHGKSSTITLTKYSHSGESPEEGTPTMEYTSLAGKMTNRTIIATLPIEPIESSPVYHLLAGVGGEGDCVSLAENVMAENRANESSSPEKGVEFQKTNRSTKKNGEPADSYRKTFGSLVTHNRPLS